MALVSMRQLLDHAAENQYGVPAFNVNNLFNVLPEWSFLSKNAAGDALLANAAAVKNQSNLITFNQRYSRMTYDGYHFSQLGTMFNLSLNYQF
jgi:iron complex outermembrane receptor protein